VFFWGVDDDADTRQSDVIAWMEIALPSQIARASVLYVWRLSARSNSLSTESNLRSNACFDGSYE
jgi:hypothetical protein